MPLLETSLEMVHEVSQAAHSILVFWSDQDIRRSVRRIEITRNLVTRFANSGSFVCLYA